MVGADGLQLGGPGLVDRRRNLGLAARDNSSPDGDMDRTARPDALRVGGGRRRPEAGWQNGVLPTRIDVERELSRRRTLGKVPRTSHRRRRVRTAEYCY